jgi:hypothetical protein
MFKKKKKIFSYYASYHVKVLRTHQRRIFIKVSKVFFHF